MRRARTILLANAVLLTVALAAAVGAAIVTHRLPLRAPPATTAAPGTPAARFVRDEAGQEVPVAPYRRIVSTTWVGDSLLLELCEPDRIVAFTRTSREDSTYAHRFAGKPAIEGLGPIEPIIALKPDIVLLTAGFGDAGRRAHLREAGIPTFDIGGMRGVASLTRAAEALAAVIGAPERGVAFARAFRARMGRVAAPLAAARRPRPRALFLSFISGHLFGGTIGTSYHDVLDAAGVIDAAAERFSGWPEYTREQLIGLDPDLIITKQGRRQELCGTTGLERLRACTRPDGVIEMPTGLMEDPGPAMLDAAEQLYREVYERPARTR